jgi:hypothetical protein
MFLVQTTVSVLQSPFVFKWVVHTLYLPAV